MGRKRTSAQKRQTKLDFNPAPTKSSPAKTTHTKKMGPTRSKRQSKIDVHNIAPKGAPKRTSKRMPGDDDDSSDDELQAAELKSMRVDLPHGAKSPGASDSSDEEIALEGSGSVSSESEVEKPAKSRKRQRAETTDEDEGTITVTTRKRRRQAGSEEEDGEELRLPGKRRRVKQRAMTPEVSDEETPPPQSTRRRLARRPATPDEEDEEEETPPKSTRRRAKRRPASPDEDEEDDAGGSQEADAGETGADDEEREELEEELAFLRSSPLPDRSRLRSTQDKPRNKRQEALEDLKRRRAGSTQEPSSTPARKTRIVIDESDSDSELEVIKEEPDSDEVGDPSSPDEDDNDEEDDREANALDMFQEDEDDTGFIDDDPDALLGEPDAEHAQLPMQFSGMSRAKPKQLFKYAVEWMVMKKIHPAFNPNDDIYELTFRKLGDEMKGLAQSKFTSSAWTPEFTKAINARPELVVNEIGSASGDFMADHCAACNRKNHPASFELSLTGNPYHPDSLEPLDADSASDSDAEIDSDDSDTSSLSAASETTGEKPAFDHRGERLPPSSTLFALGSTCKANAQVAHTLHHWRWHLFDWVKSYLQSKGHLSPEKLVKRDKKSERRREKEARKIVDEMEREGEITRLHRAYREQVQFAVEAQNEYSRGWGRR